MRRVPTASILVRGESCAAIGEADVRVFDSMRPWEWMGNPAEMLSALSAVPVYAASAHRELTGLALDAARLRLALTLAPRVLLAVRPRSLTIVQTPGLGEGWVEVVVAFHRSGSPIAVPAQLDADRSLLAVATEAVEVSGRVPACVSLNGGGNSPSEKKGAVVRGSVSFNLTRGDVTFLDFEPEVATTWTGMSTRTVRVRQNGA